MRTQRLFLLFLSLYFAHTMMAQTYPETLWLDHADTSWYNDQDEAFHITTAEEFAGLSELVKNGNSFIEKTIHLKADIDLDGHLWYPIGESNDAPFSGTIQGNNHTIANLWITDLTGDFIGLFGQTVGASFYDIKLDTAHIDVVAGDSGALVANMFTNGIIENCHAIHVDIKALGANVGGLNGGVLTDSYIKNSSFSGKVEGVNQVGGLSGNVWDKSQVINCYAEGEVHGEYIVGGLVGFGTMAFGPNRESTIENSYSRADVYATSPIGMAGGIYGYAQSSVVLNNVYATGKVSGSTDVGAFIGRVGGVILTNTYFDKEASELEEAFGGTDGPTPEGVEGKNTDEMTTAAFADVLNNENTEAPWIYDRDTNDGYPHLGHSLSVDDFIVDVLEIKLYPTTVDQEFYIYSDTALNSYAIYTITGQRVAEGNLKQGKNHTISTRNLSSGVHIVELQSATQKIAKRIIKK